MSEELQPQITAKLLKLAETVSKESVDVLFEIADIVVKDTENKIDDMIVPVLPILKKAILNYIDKISDEV